MKCKRILLLLLLATRLTSWSQDIIVSPHTSQTLSGCDLTNVQLAATITNNTTTSLNQFNLQTFYSVNGGAPISYPQGTIGGNASSEIFFPNLVDLSACQTHQLKVWIQYSGSQPNNLANDTITYTIVNSCTIVPGQIQGVDSVCVNTNNGALTLNGWNNQGTLTQWQQSTDGGATFTDISNTTTNHSFTNITQNTQYRIQFEGGFCPDVATPIFTVNTVQPETPSTITGPATICENSTATLAYGDNSSTFISWQTSTDNGATWTAVGETSPNYTTGPLAAITQFRVDLDNGHCPIVSSSPFTVSIDTPINGGTITGSTAICAALANGTLELTNNTGIIVFWEYSTDNGINWTVDPENSSTLNYSNVAQTTLYRVLSTSNHCGDTYSDTANVTITTGSLAGILDIDTTICSNNSADLALLGHLGNVIKWQESDNNTTWFDLNNTTTSLITPLLTATRQYRVIVAATGCPEDTSNVVTVTVTPTPTVNAGFDVNILEGNSATLNVTASASGSWSPPTGLSATNVTNPVASPLVTTTYTFTAVSPDGCTASDSVTVHVGADGNDPIKNFSIKNVLTLNGDGLNDLWVIEGIETYPSCAVKVWNIYGQFVYTSEAYNNDWDGTFEGKLLPNGNYYYSVIPEGSEEIFKGTLTILGNE